MTILIDIVTGFKDMLNTAVSGQIADQIYNIIRRDNGNYLFLGDDIKVLSTRIRQDFSQIDQNNGWQRYRRFLRFEHLIKQSNFN